MAKFRTLKNYKELYEFETEGQSDNFKMGYLQGAMATTNNKQIRQYLQDEIYSLLKRNS